MYAGGKGDKQEPLKGQLLSHFSYGVYTHGNITLLEGHSYTFFFNSSHMRFVDQSSFIGISGTFSF